MAGDRERQRFEFPGAVNLARHFWSLRIAALWFGVSLPRREQTVSTHHRLGRAPLRVTLVVICLVIGLQGDSLATAEDDTGELAKRFSSLCDAMLSARQTVLSGSFSVKGRKSIELEGEPALDGDLNLLCLFDRSTNSFRFERSEPRFDWTEENGQPVRGVITTGAKYGKVGDLSYHYFDGSRSVLRLDASAKPRHKARPFDPAAVGLYYWQSLEKGRSLETVLDLFQQIPPIRMDRSGDLIEIQWQIGQRGNGAHLRKLWVDAANGYTPIRMNAFIERGSGWASEPFLISEVTWKESDGCYLPSTYRIEDSFAKGRRRVYEMAFSWERVNQPFEDWEFTDKGFGVASRTALLDSQLGKAVMLRKPYSRSQPTTNTTPPEAPGGMRRTFLFATLAIIVLVGIGFFLRDRTAGGRI